MPMTTSTKVVASISRRKRRSKLPRASQKPAASVAHITTVMMKL